MKTPSIWNASTPLIAVKAAHGMNATVAALTSSAVVTTATRLRPKTRNTAVASPDSAKPHTVVMRIALLKARPLPAPMARPASCSAALAKPSRK